MTLHRFADNFTIADTRRFRASHRRRIRASAQLGMLLVAPYGELTVSIGASSIGPEEVAIGDEGWLASADAALYRAKANGRNRCETVGGREHPPEADLQPAV